MGAFIFGGLRTGYLMRDLNFPMYFARGLHLVLSQEVGKEETDLVN